ncbi:hypothetical protein [Mesorhizobium sp. P5_C1]
MLLAVDLGCHCIAPYLYFPEGSIAQPAREGKLCHRKGVLDDFSRMKKAGA